MRTLAAILATVMFLAGCGGSSDKAAPAKTTPAQAKATGATTGTGQPTIVPPTGTPAPEALSSFRCEADKKGQWSARGYLTNDGKAKVTYQVTVYVGPASGGQEDARTTRVANVAPRGSVTFSIPDIPAPKDGGACHVQVLARA